MSTPYPVYTLAAKLLRRLVRGYLVAGIIVGLGPASTDVSWAFEVPAQQTEWQLSISRAPLTDALMQLAKQAGIQFARFSDDESTQTLVGPLFGTYSREQALHLLLQGTGLAYRFVNDHTVAIIREAPPTTTPAPHRARSTSRR